MAEKHPLVDHQSLTSQKQQSNRFLIAEFATLLVGTLVLVVTFMISGFAGGLAVDPKKFGFGNGTGNISDEYYTEITPSSWAFSIWGIIYALQALWILYGWSLIFRPKCKKTITPRSYVLFSLANVFSIIWLYLWGNDFVQVAFPFVLLTSLSLWCAIGFESLFLYSIDPPVEKVPMFKIDYYTSQVLVLNGLAIYATWTAIATLINFTIVLQYYGEYDSSNTATVSLSILTLGLIVYFVLENTVLDKVLRFVGLVYPVVIWALAAVLTDHYDDENVQRNSVFAAVLLAVASVLLVIRVVFWVIFYYFRPIKSTRICHYKPIV